MLKKGLIPIFIFVMTYEHSMAQKKWAMIVFFDVECPICQTYTRRLQVLYEKHNSQIDFIVVYPTKNTKQKDIQQFQKEYDFKLPFVIDTRHEWVRKWNATTTPEVILCDSKNKILYRGSIDNQFVGLGKFRPKMTESYLLMAIEAVIDGQEIDLKTTEPIGCLINRK
jgi:thioredoxin-related protein